MPEQEQGDRLSDAPGKATERKTDPSQLKPGGVGAPADTGYRFTVESDLTTLEVVPSAVEGPRGTRMQVVYGHESDVRVDPEKDKRPPPPANLRDNAKYFEALYLVGTNKAERERLENAKAAWESSRWVGLEGKVLSGSDFLQVRADGIIELDGRVTLRANDGTLIDATYWGVIDLEKAAGVAVLAGKPGAELARFSPAYKDFVTGNFKRQELPVRLFISFDTSTGPWSTDESEDATWTKPSQARHRGNVWKYAELTRGQYLGNGTMTFDHMPGRLPKPLKIIVDVYDVDCISRGLA